MQSETKSKPPNGSSKIEYLAVGGRPVPMVLVRNRRARRYILRLRPDGVARVTVPRRGSATEARRFVERNQGWLERQLQRRDLHPNRPGRWCVGAEILFRGELVRIEFGTDQDEGWIRLGQEVIKIADPATDLRPAIESHLWRLAASELPGRVLAYAKAHQLPVRRITVRNQRTRWGSCSRRGTISLNWRLIQTPPFVRDYICLHELAHLRHMNHSTGFWREVERLCPYYRIAEGWLKQHAFLLG